MQEYIGKTLGPYQILEQVGQGGMATVFRAYQPSMDRYVAVKILPRHLSEDKSFVGRFSQEARTLARLQHPHILPVHDYGEEDGLTYLVMRYVQAGTLKDLIARQGPLPLDDAARILEQVGRALDYAHSQGVLHRDIKPSNVLVDERGDTFLTDFGIAKLVAETAQFTASGAIIGTPAYMAPEQGMAEPVDHRCDIYALGVVLYELVTGRVPYEAETPLAVMLKHINDPLPLPRQLRPGLPEAVERVILKAMAKSPDDRFQSAREMIEALRTAVAEVPAARTQQETVAATQKATVRAPSVRRPPTRPAAAAPPRAEPAAPPRRAFPWLPVAGAVLALAVVLVITVLLVVKPWGDDSEVRLTQAAATEAALALAGTPAVSPGETAPGPVAYPPGWTSYTNPNLALALARQDDFLWVGSEGGLLRWDLTDGTYVRFGLAEGLASNRIEDLLVDGEGALWAATDAGINRFDGQTWITFDETDGLDTGWIQTLFLDDTGALWAGSAYSERGLNYYDGAGWGPPPVPPLPVDFPSVTALAGNDEVGLFVGLEEEGLAYTDGEEWVVLTTEDGLPDNEVLDLLLTSDALWVGFYSGLVWFDLETDEWETFPDFSIHAMLETSDGMLWFGGEGGVLRVDPYTGDWQPFDSPPGPFPGWLATDIVEDDDRLWFSTWGQGAVSYDGSVWDTWATDAEVGGNWIEAIRQDTAGVLWFAHPGTGLTRHDPGRDVWQSFGRDDGVTDWPSIPAVDSSGNLWVGEDEELFRYDGQSWETFTPPELEGLTVYEIDIAPDDVQWMDTDAGLMRHEPATGAWTVFTGADHPILDAFWTFYVGRDGTLWVGGEQGLAEYDGSTWADPEASGAAPEFVDDITDAPDGSLWVAADGDLYHLRDGQWEWIEWPYDGWMERIAVAPDGGVWAGYEGFGRFDPASRTWQAFTPADGLVHPLVLSIHVTPEGVVWVGTAGGLSRYVPPVR
jgi:ligand-binding sensor domain-containing protein